MENEGLFKALVEKSGNFMIATDNSLTIRYASPSVLNLTGIYLLNKNLEVLIGADKAHAWEEKLFTGSINEEISLNISGKDQFYYDVTSTLLDGQMEGTIAFYFNDITKRKLKEYELMRANQQLDQMIYKTTHDLKAPIKSALGLVNLAKMSDDHEKIKYIQMISKSLLKLDGYIEEMNGFFRNEKLALQRERIDLRELLAEELEHLDYFGIANKIKIDFELASDTNFYSDSIRVKTILTNILSNAIKYSDPKKSEPFIKIYVSINEDFCQIRVDDNGIGIEQKYLDKIFDLFFRATEHSQGTGLGLFIVKDTIEKLKGEIEVISNLGEGTTFLITIPNQIHQPATVV